MLVLERLIDVLHTFLGRLRGRPGTPTVHVGASVTAAVGSATVQ